jgi:hypothetical protein
MMPVAAFIAGRVIGRMPDLAPGASEMEDLVGAVIDELAQVGERFTLERADGQPMDEDYDEATAYHVAAIDAWDEINLEGVEPAEFVIRRWVLVAEDCRGLPHPPAPRARTVGAVAAVSDVGTGVMLCATEAEARGYGALYEPRELPDGGWLAVPKHP